MILPVLCPAGVIAPVGLFFFGASLCMNPWLAIGLWNVAGAWLTIEPSPLPAFFCFSRQQSLHTSARIKKPGGTLWGGPVFLAPYARLDAEKQKGRSRFL